MRQVLCPMCLGTGGAKDAARPCETCAGFGRVYQRESGGREFRRFARELGFYVLYAVFLALVIRLAWPLIRRDWSLLIEHWSGK